MNWTPEKRLKLIKALADKSSDGAVGETQQRLTQRIMFLCDMPGWQLERNEWICEDVASNE